MGEWVAVRGHQRWCPWLSRPRCGVCSRPLKCRHVDWTPSWLLNLFPPAPPPPLAPRSADGVFVSRMGGSVEYGRPLGLGWQGSLGLSWQQARCVDEHGQPMDRDCYGGPLTFSGREHDTMALGLIRVAYK